MSKLLKFDNEARDALKKGAKTIADAVGATYGILGRNVILAPRLAPPRVIHDGMLVSKDIQLPDPFEDAGAQVIKEAAKKTCDLAGDGTTASIVFSYALIDEGLKAIDTGANPMKVRQGMLKAKDILVEEIKKQAIPLQDTDIRKIATISAQDNEIGDIVAETMEKVGKDGIIHVEDSWGRGITSETREGIEFLKGLTNQAFIQAKGTDSVTLFDELSDTLVLITDHRIDKQEDMFNILQQAQFRGKNLLIIASEVTAQAEATLMYNAVMGQKEINAISVFAPGYSNVKSEYLDDIALLTGGKFISRQSGKKLSSIAKEDFGTAEKIIAGIDKTTIIGAKGDKKLTDERIAKLKVQLDNEEADFRKEQLRERIARLIGGVAVIKVGAVTETEASEKKERVIDAVAAVRAAMEEGIVAGGATMLIKASSFDADNADEDIAKGMKAVKNACIMPFQKLISNAGLNFSDCYKQVQFNEDPEMGIDTIDGHFKDLIDAGIIDPVKVVRLTVEHAVSVAGSIITTSVVIVDKPEERNHGTN